MYAYFCQEDSSLIFLSEKPKDGDIADWEEKSAKTKSNIILCLYDAVLAKNKGSR